MVAVQMRPTTLLGYKVGVDRAMAEPIGWPTALLSRDDQAPYEIPFFIDPFDLPVYVT